jgi:hypothetical protein
LPQSEAVGNTTTDIPWWIVENTHLNCTPAWASYHFSVGYEDGVRKLSYSTSNEQRLADLYAPRTSYPEAASCTEANQGCTNAYAKFDFGDKQLRNMRVADIYALIDSVWRALAGTHPAYMERSTTNATEYVFPNSTKINIFPSSGRLQHGATDRSLGIGLSSRATCRNRLRWATSNPRDFKMNSSIQPWSR